MTVREALAEATMYIPRRDAERLLAHVTGRSRTWILAYPESEVHPDLMADFNALIRRRDSGEPLQYLLGTQDFFGLDLRVTPEVLIPRPETEHLVEAALAWAARLPHTPLRVLDVGTGSGAIALALATRLPHDARLPHEIVAVDVSPGALEVAQDNAARLALSDRVLFLQSDLLAGLEAQIGAGVRFDMVLSNPPYVPLGDAATMQREVVDHEPHRALFAGADGLEVYRRLVPQAHRALRPGGLLAMEIGWGQEEALRKLLGEAAQWTGVEFLPDLQGIARVVLASRG